MIKIGENLCRFVARGDRERVVGGKKPLVRFKLLRRQNSYNPAAVGTVRTMLHEAGKKGEGRVHAEPAGPAGPGGRCARPVGLRRGRPGRRQ